MNLKDVARAAGVSHMTVSRVVRGERTVKAATAERVRRFLDQLGYQPDPALSALAAYRARGRARARDSVLAFIETEQREYNELLLEGARSEAAGLGYTVQSFSLPAASAGRRELCRQLFHRGIRGLMFSPSDQPFHLREWDWVPFAAMAMGALRHEPVLHAVAMDYFQGLQTALVEMKKRGHRRIGLLLQESIDQRTNHLWLGAYLASAQPILTPFIFRQARTGAAALHTWVVREKPDAVLTIHADWHERLRRIGVVSAYLNDIGPQPGAPHLRLDARYIGRESVQLVHRLLLRQEYGLPALPRAILLRAEWEPGNSTHLVSLRQNC